MPMVLAFFFCNYLGSTRCARTEGEKVVHFSAKPKNEPPLFPFCQLSEQKVSKLAFA
jgi:hypothetical protein